MGPGGAGKLRVVSNLATIVIDMLNPYDHEDAEKLVPSVREALPRIVELRDRARETDETGQEVRATGVDDEPPLRE